MQNPQKQLKHIIHHYFSEGKKEQDSERGNKNKIPEIEVRFGTKGIKPISKIDFDNVVKKLKSLDFAVVSSDIYTLKIGSEFLDATSGRYRDSNVRVEIEGLGAIQEYCQTNDLESLINSSSKYKITFTRKTLTFEQGGDKILPAEYTDFNFRVSYNTEEKLSAHSGIVKEMLKNWVKVKKTFRYMCRTSFNSNKYPFQIDLSIVRSSNWNKETRRPSKTYTIKESNVFENPMVYEIEGELNSVKSMLKYTEAEVVKEIENISTIVLSGLQKSNFPISYKKQKEVMERFLMLIQEKEYNPTQRVVPKMFLGPSSKTLQIDNIVANSSNSYSPNIRKNFLVTEKADGTRNLLFIDKGGKLYMINMNMEVSFTGMATENKELEYSILDGEMILHDKLGKFLNLFATFDIYYLKGKDIRHYPFLKTEKHTYENRLEVMQSVINNLALKSVVANSSTGNNFKIISKKFYPSESSKENMIFPACNIVGCWIGPRRCSRTKKENRLGTFI